MTMWEKLPPLDTGGGATCFVNGVGMGYRPTRLRMYQHIAVGFGIAGIMRDGKFVWTEDVWPKRLRRVASAETMARKDPDHDWRIVLDAPLSMAEYQRHDRNNWVLVKKGMGFA